MPQGTLRLNTNSEKPGSRRVGIWMSLCSSSKWEAFLNMNIEYILTHIMIYVVETERTLNKLGRHIRVSYGPWSIDLNAAISAVRPCYYLPGSNIRSIGPKPSPDPPHV